MIIVLTNFPKMYKPFDYLRANYGSVHEMNYDNRNIIRRSAMWRPRAQASEAIRTLYLHYDYL